MAHTLKLRNRANRDLGEIYEWNKEQRVGLEEEFLLSVQDVFISIGQNPEIYSEVYPKIRKCNLRRFPYSVYYKIFKKSIAILAVYHHSRNPKHWKTRKL